MEAGEAGSRQRFAPNGLDCDPNGFITILTYRGCSSGNPTANSFHPFDRPHRERIDTSYSNGTMATALVSSSAPYQHHAPYNSGYPHSAPPTSIAAMISPVEPRRPSDEPEPAQSHRQSLPSISEVISGAKPVQFSAPPPAQLPSPQGLPSPFTSAPSRPFGEVPADKNSSPRALHPSSSGYPGPETLPAFSDPARPALASRPVPPPLNTFAGQNQSPPVKFEQLEAEQRHAEAQSLGAGHRQPAQPLPALYTDTGKLPPGQLPLSAYPVSPRHTGPALPSPYESQRSGAHGEEDDYPHHRISDYKAAFDKHFETWGYQEALQQVGPSNFQGSGDEVANLSDPDRELMSYGLQFCRGVRSCSTGAARLAANPI
jgi:hypothetical protein